MQDADHDGRADRIVLTYSERVSFPGGPGGGPFTVAGYAIGSVLPARLSRTLTIVLREKAAADPDAAPSVRYTPFACRGGDVVDGERRVGSVRGSGVRSCEATFTEVPLGGTYTISILGTWLPSTPVGGCDDFTINDPDGGVVTTDPLLLTATGFGECLIP